jgi:hypothetical protein
MVAHIRARIHEGDGFSQPKATAWSRSSAWMRVLSPWLRTCSGLGWRT